MEYAIEDIEKIAKNMTKTSIVSLTKKYLTNFLDLQGLITEYRQTSYDRETQKSTGPFDCVVIKVLYENNQGNIDNSVKFLEMKQQLVKALDSSIMGLKLSSYETDVAEVIDNLGFYIKLRAEVYSPEQLFGHDIKPKNDMNLQNSPRP
jgi:hypothetical protein